MVFSALTENNGSLQITATSVLTLLAQQTGVMTSLIHSEIQLYFKYDRRIVSLRSAVGL